MSPRAKAPELVFPFPPVLDPHIELLLTVKLGPSAGATWVNCTCGWERDYKTRWVAIRELNQHRKINGLPPTHQWDQPRKAAA